MNIFDVFLQQTATTTTYTFQYSPKEQRTPPQQVANAKTQKKKKTMTTPLMLPERQEEVKELLALSLPATQINLAFWLWEIAS